MVNARPVSDTVIICRPAQFREAAILLSCFSTQCFTPLIALEPPPSSEAAYRTLHEDYRTARFRRDDVIGGPIGQHQFISGQTSVISNADVDRKAEALTPYRSWWKHNRIISELLAKQVVRRALFLCEPSLEEFAPINPVPTDKILDQRFPLLQDRVDRIYLLPKGAHSNAGARLYNSMEELFEISWQICQPGAVVPKTCIKISIEDEFQVFAGLHRALTLRLPLVPAAGSNLNSLPEMQLDAAASEAVLIEVSPDARRLLGVQYAHERDAKLVLYREPDVSPIEAARQAMEQWGDEATKSAGSIRAFLIKFFATGVTTSPDPLHALEAAVSSVVPDTVVKEVGPLPLTAFTSGVPYGFVRKMDADWAQKPIGHVTGDATVLVLSELLRRPEAEGVEFNVVFDPGFFQTNETSDVLAVLEGRISHTLVLREDEASMLALLHLASCLPVEIVYFNTHGSEKAIKLKEGWWPTFKIVQRLDLGSRPIVFNNSCLSWVGVGRDFVRTGARAYIGTLWSVDAEAAAKYARGVLHNIIQGNMPVAKAMLVSGIDPLSRRAYVLVGTCNAALDPSKPSDNDQALAVKAIRYLADAAITLARQSDSILPFVTMLQDHLLTETEAMWARYQARWPEPSLAAFEVLVRRMMLLAELVDRWRAKVQERAETTIEQAGRILDALGLDAKEHHKQRAQWLQMAARLRYRLGYTEAAIQNLSTSIEEAHQAGLPAGPQYLELADTQKSLGRLDLARDAAEKAEQAYVGDSKESSNGRMLALGRLASISNLLNKAKDAIEFAKRGFLLAQGSGNLSEQAEFKLDEARAQLGLQQYDDAFAAASEGQKLARRAHHAARELSAQGIMVGALLGKRDMDRALQVAEEGLQHAKVQARPSEIGDFLMDIAKIKVSRASEDAFNGAFASVFYYAAAGQVKKLREALGFLTELFYKIQTWDIARRLISCAVAVAHAGDADLRQRMALTTISLLKSMIDAGNWQRAQLELASLVADLTAIDSDQGPLFPPEAALVVRVAKLFLARAQGAQTQAIGEAKQLDVVSGDRFQLAKFVAT